MYEKREAIRHMLVRHALEKGALTFGNHRLKSERVSPYFFNSALLADGRGLALLGAAYASTLAAEAPHFDTLYGPPYKGISLASVTGAALSEHHSINRGVIYSRKEVKDHGEGGLLVGGDFVGKRVLIVDDVLTAGTAIVEACRLIREYGDAQTHVVAAIVALDRQERGSDDSGRSAVQVVEQDLGLKVLSVFTFDYLIKAVEASTGALAAAARPWLGAMREYRAEYGV